MINGVVDEIKQRVDIVDLISRYVPLKKAGSTYKACCPFHNERTPSFVIFPQTNSWHCFGACGTGGDVFAFLMRKENLDFREALQSLAQEIGIDVSEATDDQAERQKEALYAINGSAATYFRTVLHRHPAAQEARAYLQQRGIDSKTAELFHLGYALEGWNGLQNALTAQGYSLEQQLEAGLLKHNADRNSNYDAFRGRLMIPIRDRQQRIIGFGGRTINANQSERGQPKYLNTSETPIFHKSHVVYGLDMAYKAIREAAQVVIVEGYMDVIAAHQKGFANVVACMGTALTVEQLRQLHRYTDNFVLALDADTAGQQATIRGLNQARQALAKVRKPTVTATGRVRLEEKLGADLFIVSMPEDQDPDDVIRQTPDDWQQLVENASPLVDFYFTVVVAQADLESARGKGLAVAELAPLIAELNDEIEREHYVQRLSRLVQIDERTIENRVRAVVKTVQVTQVANEKQGERWQQSRLRINRPAKAEQPPALPDGAYISEPVGLESVEFESIASEAPIAPLNGANSSRFGQSQRISPVPNWATPFNTVGADKETFILANLLQEPNLLVRLALKTENLGISPIQVSDFHDVINQEIFRALKQFISSDEPWDAEFFQEMLTDHLHGHLGRLMAYDVRLPMSYGAELTSYNIREFVDETLVRLIDIREQHIGEENRNIQYLLDEAEENHEKVVLQSHLHKNLRMECRLQLARTQVRGSQFRQDHAGQGLKIH